MTPAEFSSLRFGDRVVLKTVDGSRLVGTVVTADAEDCDTDVGPQPCHLVDVDDYGPMTQLAQSLSSRIPVLSDLHLIRGRASLATPGPWVPVETTQKAEDAGSRPSYSVSAPSLNRPDEKVRCMVADCGPKDEQTYCDVVFIANVREDVVRLSDEVLRLRRLLRMLLDAYHAGELPVPVVAFEDAVRRALGPT